ncbi:uncharacterized protein Z519_08930 [Cladophialophora bantiana CBS 173.52]|uniref:Uncharacterized protein n=1 Tax=Cladophialophora bantiana (strain ATCC 10958 / CBS 173.52 / CDC B-1940 / NIH 8579) TaxID=1442370 RepID=A0A0D2EJU0_CLAB1|nr:uncharacterized protein Z519_08930 [Cladophialophora bantiana CBS 173.52]KIW90286.1 hypothetical protein Z519_08930 [Cladophialophora bantiana CBS 173.52]
MTDLNITDTDIGDKLRGKTAIVTGGSSGIGLSIVQKLAASGVRVLVGDVQPLREAVEGVLYMQTDTSRWEDLLSLFKRAVKEWSRIDIVIPNAGIGDKGDFFDKVDESGDPVKPKFDCLSVTLIGQMYTVKLAMHYMRRQVPQGGVIVSTVSRAGYVAESIPVYGAAKHGMVGLMRALRPLTKTWNIRINSIAPGITDTPALRTLPDLVPKLWQSGIPMNTSDDCALAAVFLCANEDYNGNTIFINGGKFREVESGYKRHLKDIMGNDKRLSLNCEEKKMLGQWIHSIFKMRAETPSKEDIFTPSSKY